MKVLHVLYSKVFTGAEKVVSQIIHMFDGEDGAEMVYCSRESEIVETILAEEGIPFVPVKDLVPAELKRVIREQKPDIIHAHDMRASFVAALSCGSIPLISHIHNNAFDARGLSAKSVAYLLAGFRAKHIFWVSRSAYEGYCFHRLFAKKSSVLQNIIDTDAIRRKMAQDPNTYAFDVIFLGRLTEPKNPQRLMQVCAKAAEKKPDLRVAVVGTGELEEQTRALCAQLGLADNVSFLGFRSNPLKILHDSGVMVMTSRWEGTPMCALEAMALGVPVVSTPTDGLKDLIEDGADGCLSDDDGVLADAIVRICGDPALRETMSCNVVRKSGAINDLRKYKEAVALQYRENMRKKP